jgi:hypothetical protein
MKDALFRLRSDQLAGLLGVGAGGRRVSKAEDAAIAEALDARLAGELPLDATKSGSLSAVLGRSCDKLNGYRGRAMIALLLDPGTDVAALKVLRDYAKELVRQSRSEVDKAVATALYYAVIGAALVFCGEKLAERDHGRLGRSFAQLIEKPWVPEDLRTLLEKARDTCLMHAGKDGAEEDA